MTATVQHLHVSSYESADRDAVYDVSVRTAHADHHSNGVGSIVGTADTRGFVTAFREDH